MKVKKEDLEELTKDAAKLGMLALNILTMTGCPYPDMYEFVEKFEVKVDGLREQLGLEKLMPPELGEGLLSKKVAEREALREIEATTKKPNRSIGFQIPSDPSKMN